MISPELQSIIDKVTGYATTPIPGSRGPTASQGRALLGIAGGMFGLEQQGMGDRAKVGMANASAVNTDQMIKKKLEREGLGLGTDASGKTPTGITPKPGGVGEPKPTPDMGPGLPSDQPSPLGSKVISLGRGMTEGEAERLYPRPSQVPSGWGNWSGGDSGGGVQGD